MSILDQEKSIAIIKEKGYSYLLGELNTYVIDNITVKDRSLEQLSAKELNDKVENFENVGVQYGENLDIYCQEERKEDFEKTIDRFLHEYKDKIKVYTAL